MDVLALLNLSDVPLYCSKMSMFPLFDLAYYIVSILYLKYEPGAVEVSRRSPIASWMSAMLYCFASYIMADVLLGESPLQYFSNTSHILLATAVWYLTFYCPLNLFYKCVSFMPVKLVLVAMKEVVRVRKISVGVVHAHHAYHHGWIIMALVGWAKGAGVALISNFEQLVRGVWKPETNEFLNMSFPTKASLVGAVLFTLQQARWLPISKHNIVFLFTAFMVVTKVFMTARHSHGSPFAPIEAVICPILFGAASFTSDEHEHSHSRETSQSYSPSSISPYTAKSKEELNEGTRKKKTKKVE
ncbi:trimeric intracellular cation channel type A [Callorhinchus milii]|uniref:Trimeric intracellular cation channel type A n=1 Tax=Callorhinchus milii TaxID=7868 RepID=V9KEB5_CALMI|nr:trimeric intracellular cation channel type A [Callorhinchus milii]|eukprot:gi/632966091/ref/XP_007899226.1/ PREDICTED: trimeric intracellular cation channel type A [Callorhinchus milii]